MSSLAPNLFITIAVTIFTILMYGSTLYFALSYFEKLKLEDYIKANKFKIYAVSSLILGLLIPVIINLLLYYI